MDWLHGADSSQTLRVVREGLGDRPFRPKRVINAAILEAVLLTTMENRTIDAERLKRQYWVLVADKAFDGVIRGATTDTKIVKDRLTIARAILLS